MIILQNDLQKLMKWFTSNGMSFIPENFQIIIQELKNKYEPCLNMRSKLIPSNEHIILQGKKLKGHSSEKYTGITAM